MNDRRRMREQIAQQPPLKRRASATQANPHHAGFYAGMHPEDAPYQSSQFVRQQVPVADEEELDNSYYQVRAPLSSRRYTDVQEDANRTLVRCTRRSDTAKA